MNAGIEDACEGDSGVEEELFAGLVPIPDVVVGIIVAVLVVLVDAGGGVVDGLHELGR